jgi:hypothetical protein
MGLVEPVDDPELRGFRILGRSFEEGAHFPRRGDDVLVGSAAAPGIVGLELSRTVMMPLLPW